MRKGGGVPSRLLFLQLLCLTLYLPTLVTSSSTPARKNLGVTLLYPLGGSVAILDVNQQVIVDFTGLLNASSLPYRAVDTGAGVLITNRTASSIRISYTAPGVYTLTAHATDNPTSHLLMRSGRAAPFQRVPQLSVQHGSSCYTFAPMSPWLLVTSGSLYLQIRDPNDTSLARTLALTTQMHQAGESPTVLPLNASVRVVDGPLIFVPSLVAWHVPVQLSTPPQDVFAVDMRVTSLGTTMWGCTTRTTYLPLTVTANAAAIASVPRTALTVETLAALSLATHSLHRCHSNLGVALPARNSSNFYISHDSFASFYNNTAPPTSGIVDVVLGLRRLLVLTNNSGLYVSNSLLNGSMLTKVTTGFAPLDEGTSASADARFSRDDSCLPLQQQHNIGTDIVFLLWNATHALQSLTDSHTTAWRLVSLPAAVSVADPLRGLCALERSDKQIALIGHQIYTSFLSSSSGAWTTGFTFPSTFTGTSLRVHANGVAVLAAGTDALYVSVDAGVSFFLIASQQRMDRLFTIDNTVCAMDLVSGAATCGDIDASSLTCHVPFVSSPLLLHYQDHMLLHSFLPHEETVTRSIGIVPGTQAAVARSSGLNLGEQLTFFGGPAVTVVSILTDARARLTPARAWPQTEPSGTVSISLSLSSATGVASFSSPSSILFSDVGKTLLVRSSGDGFLITGFVNSTHVNVTAVLTTSSSVVAAPFRLLDSRVYNETAGAGSSQTLTISADETQAVLSGTTQILAFDPSHVGLIISIRVSSAWAKIVAVTNATHVTIARGSTSIASVAGSFTAGQWSMFLALSSVSLSPVPIVRITPSEVATATVKRIRRNVTADTLYLDSLDTVVLKLPSGSLSFSNPSLVHTQMLNTTHARLSGTGTTGSSRVGSKDIVFGCPLDKKLALTNDFTVLTHTSLPVNYRPPSEQGRAIPTSAHFYNADPTRAKRNNFFPISQRTGVFKGCAQPTLRKLSHWIADSDCIQSVPQVYYIASFIPRFPFQNKIRLEELNGRKDWCLNTTGCTGGATERTVLLDPSKNDAITWRGDELYHFRAYVAEGTFCSLSTEFVVYVMYPPLNKIIESVVVACTALGIGFLLLASYLAYFRINGPSGSRIRDRSANLTLKKKKTKQKTKETLTPIVPLAKIQEGKQE